MMLFMFWYTEPHSVILGMRSHFLWCCATLSYMISPQMGLDSWKRIAHLKWSPLVDGDLSKSTFHSQIWFGVIGHAFGVSLWPSCYNFRLPTPSCINTMPQCQLVVWASLVVCLSHCLNRSLSCFASLFLTLLLVSVPFAMASSAVWQGAKGTCECEEFYPSEENDCICKECTHGKSNHPHSLLTSTGQLALSLPQLFNHPHPLSTTGWPAALLPQPSNPPPSRAASSLAVHVFHNIVGKRGLLLTGGSSIPRNQV